MTGAYLWTFSFDFRNAGLSADDKAGDNGTQDGFASFLCTKLTLY